MTTLAHPLQRWPRHHRRLAFVCVVVVAVLPLVFGAIAHPLHEDEPGGAWRRLGHTASPWPELSRVGALLEFGAIRLSLAYGLSGIVAVSISRTRWLQAEQG